MIPILILTTRFLLVTPAWVGGADQRAELRLPTFKGLLRFWYRAIDADFRPTRGASDACWEEIVFGSTLGDGRAARVHLSLEKPSLPRTLSWNPDVQTSLYNEGQGRITKNGLVYLGYPFQLRGNEKRNALAPGQEFTLVCRILGHPEDRAFGEASAQGIEPGRLVKAVLSSLWLLGALGTMGTRSRRGFGSLQLLDWGIYAARTEALKTAPHLARVVNADRLERDAALIADWKKCMDQLPLPGRVESAQEYSRALNAGLNTLWGWFRPFRESARHPHFGKHFGVFLPPIPGELTSRWEAVLNHLGRKMQDFRSRRAPDYQDVKDIVQGVARPPFSIPERATFGLPLTFRYRSLPNSRPITFAPSPTSDEQVGDRHPSLVFFKVLKLGQRYFPLVYRLDGALPGFHLPVSIQGGSQQLRAPKKDLLGDFMAHLKQA